MRRSRAILSQVVYVDRARNPFKGMIMCHMIADSLDELHAAAEQLGMRRGWFHGHASFPHYDVNLETRAAALRLGALDCDRAAFVACMRRIRPTLPAVWARRRSPEFR